MKNGMKQMEIGEIPAEWEVKKLEEISDFITKGSTPTTYGYDWVKEGIVFLRSECVSAQGFSLSGAMHISEEAHHTMSRSIITSGDILMTITGNVGRVCVLPEEIGEANINQHIARIRISDSEVDSQFVYQFLAQEEVIREYSKITTGQAYPQLSLKQVRETYVPLPPLPEQREIAEILSTLDEKMAVIDEQLAQTQELKKGLMQRLLTRGIGHTQFKDSPLGDIPASWEVRLLDEVTKRGSGHTPSKNFPEYYGGGIKWVSLADSAKLDNGWIKDTKTSISSLGIKNSSARLHPKGTVLLSRDAGIGKSAVMHADMAVSQHFITWTCNGEINNWFLYYYLQLNKPLFERIAAGSTIKTIGLPFFKKFSIPVPTAFEQEKIAEILTTVDDKIGVLQDKKAQYHTLKKGLMQQLLTGQRRVRVGAPAETAALV